MKIMLKLGKVVVKIRASSSLSLWIINFHTDQRVIRGKIK